MYILESKDWFDYSTKALKSHYYLYILSRANTYDPSLNQFEQTELISKDQKTNDLTRLMYGYSIELLMKFMINIHINNNEETSHYGHRLSNLLKEINNRYNQKDLLEYLQFVKDYEETILWSGRYPFANKPQHDKGLRAHMPRLHEVDKNREAFWTLLLKTLRAALDDNDRPVYEAIRSSSLGTNKIISDDEFIGYVRKQAFKRISEVGKSRKLNVGHF